MNSHKQPLHLSQKAAWVIAICSISILTIYTFYYFNVYHKGLTIFLTGIGAPTLAILWLAATNIPTWIRETSKYYQDAVISPEDQKRYNASIIMKKVEENLAKLKSQIIHYVFEISIYDENMRRQGFDSEKVCHDNFIVQGQEQYKHFTNDDLKTLKVAEPTLSACDARAENAIKQSHRFKTTTWTFLGMNLFFLLCTILNVFTLQPGVFIQYLALYTVGAIVYGLYIMPICAIKHKSLPTRYTPSQEDLKKMVDRVLKDTNNLSPAENDLKQKIEYAENKLLFEMIEIVDQKVNYFENYDLYYRVTHNDKMDYHYLIAPQEKNDSSLSDDSIMYNPYYFYHTPADPFYSYYKKGLLSDFKSFYYIYKQQHPNITFSQDEINKINGEGLEYSTFVLFDIFGGQHIDERFLESNLLIPYPNHDDGRDSGKAHEFDIIFICKKGFFVIECKNWHGTIKGNVYDSKDGFNKYLEYKRPNGAFQKLQNPIVQNRSHIHTLRKRITMDVFGGNAPKIPYYNIVITSDRLDIKHLNTKQNTNQPVQKMFWVRYGKISDFFEQKVVAMKDVITYDNCLKIDNYLSQWRYPTEEQMRIHNERNEKLENDNFLV